ncbi:hypothetical protein GGR56DRAFT_453430 [Xylariaceae sp. FL0804]|nr:hypothetical protein GGR56DRAFT_453430 [Xylariaceae sp. FL0804]
MLFACSEYRLHPCLHYNNLYLEYAFGTTPSITRSDIMATATETPVSHGPSRSERLNTEDFDTASIRSAAPSYISELPPHYSGATPPAYTPLVPSPPYEPAPPAPAVRSPPPAPPPLLPPLPSPPIIGAFSIGAGLPQSPRHRHLHHHQHGRRRSEAPDLSSSPFRMSAWSSPPPSSSSAGLYQRVASRRVSSSSASAAEDAVRAALDRVNAAAAAAAAAHQRAERDRFRPLEDPYLVGEEAAAQARRQRLAAQRDNGDEILVRENQRWDWLLGQMKDSEERERHWTSFRRNLESGGRRKLTRRMGR